MSNMFITIIIGLIITFLLIHHSATHENNSPFEIIDFKNALMGNVKSHEGIILIIMFVIFGIILGMKL